MKVELEGKEKVFTPFTVKLTFESQKEVDSWLHELGKTSEVTDVLFDILG